MRCRCYKDDEGMRMLGSALAYAMTEYYAVFRKKRIIRFLFWDIQHEDTVDVHIPKYHEDNYQDKLMEFKKECIALIDLGYTNGNIDDILTEEWREQIAEHQQKLGRVWE